MKLTLLFIAMDLITILAYPIVFLHGRFRHFSRFKPGITSTGLWVSGPTLRGR